MCAASSSCTVADSYPIPPLDIHSYFAKTEANNSPPILTVKIIMSGKINNTMSCLYIFLFQLTVVLSSPSTTSDITLPGTYTAGEPAAEWFVVEDVTVTMNGERHP